MGFTDESKVGEPVEAGDATIYPISHAINLLFSNGSGGLIWNRPSAILVRSADGSEQVLRVQDVTRRAQVVLLALGLAGSLLIWFALKGKNDA